MKEKVKQIPVCYKSIDDLKKLAKELAENGFKLLHGLDDINDDSNIVAIIIDTEDKKVFRSNATCMACWCSSFGHPMNAIEVMNNFSEFVIKRNKEEYDTFLEKLNLKAV